MKERAKQALRVVREYDEQYIEKQWQKGGWEKLKSFQEVGLDRDTTLLSLFGDTGNKGEKYDKFIKEIRLSNDSRKDIWLAVTLFLNDTEVNMGKDIEPTIGDFEGLKAKQLQGLINYSPIRARILEKLFAPSSTNL